MDPLEKLHAANRSGAATAAPGIDTSAETVGIQSQVRLVIRIILTVSLCEAVVVAIVYSVPALPLWLEVFLDAAFMVLLLSPMMYFAVIRPMVRYILAQKRSEEQLKRHGDHLESLVDQRTSELSAANATLRQQVRVRTECENLMQERTFELDDYIRELQCLYAISRLMEKPDISIEELVTKTIGLIPFAWLDPEKIAAQVTLNGREFKTDNYRQTQQRQTGEIVVNGRCIGVLEVACLKETAEPDPGLLKPQREKSLIEAVSERLGGILERIATAQQLKQELALNAALSNLYKPLIAPSASIEKMADAVLSEAARLTESRRGYLAAIDPLKDGTIAYHVTVMAEDSQDIAAGKKIVVCRETTDDCPGPWELPLNSPEAFYLNSFQDHPAAAGVLKGQVPVQRFLAVPVTLGAELIGQIALADKEDDYTDRDLAAIRRMAEFYALALQRNRTAKALQESKEELERRVAERTREIARANSMLKGQIEERKLAEKKLQRNKTMLQSVFDGIADPLILVDRDMTVKMINRAAAKYYGAGNNQDTVGIRWPEAVENTEFFDGFEMPSTVLNKQVFSFERKGFIAPARLERVFIYPVKEKKKDLGDAVIRITDITEERRIENQLIQSEKMSSLGILVSSIAHEINNPNSFVTFNMPILIEYIEALIPFADEYAAGHPDLELFNMSYPEFRADIRKLLENIEHGSRRISSFVSNLREYAQYDDTKPKKLVDLSSVIDKVLAICGSSLKKSVTSFDLQMPNNFPAVYTNAHVLEQVLLNLLVNASQAADKSESWIKLDVSPGNSLRDHTIIEVSDNGCGMDEEIKRHIFDPFFTTRSTAGGTGLGLYVCHNLIRGIGGYIEVESESGKGSIFRVILPDKGYRKQPI